MKHSLATTGVKSFIALLGLMLVSATASAAYVQLAPAQQPNDGNITLPPAGFTATYSTAAPISSIWFDGDVSPQSPESVAASIVSQFGGPITLTGQIDSFNGGSLTIAGGFDILAIHLGGQGGGNELLFFFDSSITSFEVNTFSQGGSSNISNVRAYQSSVIPVPAAVWLFGSALLGLAALRRR